MISKIESVETCVVTIPRETPYLGPLGEGEEVNRKGYLVRAGNRTVYPSVDRSVIVKITDASGTVGWGETYGICAPNAVTEIIEDLLAPVIEGRNALDVACIHEDLYDMMHVRGYFGGFYLDALAAIDIALWDIFGKHSNQTVAQLLGGTRRKKIPAYVSGLPESTLEKRCALAKKWQDKGFTGFKFAGVVSHEGMANEMAALRETLGPDADIMVDMHWKFSAAEATRVIKAMEPHNLYFAEAPCAPEDIEGLATVARSVATPVAAGEEWRTVFEARERVNRNACSILQPEMGHTGITQFSRISQLAQAFHCRIIPHASIGVGIFQAASLHASANVLHLPYHEYQHSVFDRNLQFLETDMDCRNGYFSLPSGPGLGVTPSKKLWAFSTKDLSS
ncbi:mandelate racemase/muconate lactonizing enzyme family protein [Microbulbifer sp. ARAS458-1]|uniref:mandelate racemase/muconate lactonizing enzyme family protein n=1 Tax=Microbulbifer sp. ARAS458-1 TaxID=3140242 RepID=UPI0038780168